MIHEAKPENTCQPISRQEPIVSSGAFHFWQSGRLDNTRDSYEPKQEELKAFYAQKATPAIHYNRQDALLPPWRSGLPARSPLEVCPEPADHQRNFAFMSLKKVISTIIDFVVTDSKCSSHSMKSTICTNIRLFFCCLFFFFVVVVVLLCVVF